MKEFNQYLDVGCGTFPDFFLRCAKEDPHSRYYAVDPTCKALHDIELPTNLLLVSWQGDEKSGLPFPKHSIDGIFLNNLYAELRRKGRNLNWADTEGIFDAGYYDAEEINCETTQAQLYAKILDSCLRVLKQTGSITITEPFENFALILPICYNHGLIPTTEPHFVTDINRSRWTTWFYDIYALIDPDDGKYDAAPTEVTIRPYTSLI